MTLTNVILMSVKIMSIKPDNLSTAQVFYKVNGFLSAIVIHKKVESGGDSQCACK